MLFFIALRLIILRRPGVASAFTPSAGIVHEWRTSVEDTIIWIGVFLGILTEVSVSNERLVFCDMNESKSKFLKFLYSYDQYHWCPIDFIDSG